MNTIFAGSGLSTALFSLLSACFKMASDRAKWSNYVHSHISGTQAVNAAPFCAGTQARVPEHQLRTVTYSTAEILVWELEATLSSYKCPASAVS